MNEITAVDTLVGEITLENKPREICWGTPDDFLKLLTQVLSVRFPVNLANEFVVVGFQTPSPDDQGRMWARFDASRNWLGWHAFQKGNWRRVYEYRSDEIIWMVGDSRSIPDGFQLVDSGAPLPTATIEHIKSFYLETNPGTGAYRYFAVRFLGYS